MKHGHGNNKFWQIYFIVLYKWGSGDTYEGDLKDNNIHGRGVVTL